MQSWIANNGLYEVEKEILSNPVVRDVYKGKRTFVSQNKNLLKEYLESS